MAKSRKANSRLLNNLNLPFGVAVACTLAFYTVIHLPYFHDTLLHRYTTEHNVEYVIVWFFIWGVVDLVFRVTGMPKENAALRHQWLPPRQRNSPIGEAEKLYDLLQQQPESYRKSRIGQRYAKALQYLNEKGSADEFAMYLKHLAEQDEEQTHTNFGLIRFIAWVTPVLGFLGTVVHFGTALGGLSVDELTERLPAVVSQMGTAFNTTTGALVAATTMMFAQFIGDRAERKILHQIDRSAEDELLTRFEIENASMRPFLLALETAGRSTLSVMESTVQRQIDLWQSGIESVQRQSNDTHYRQAQIWSETMKSLQDRYEKTEQERERRFQKLLAQVEERREEHRSQMAATFDQLQALQGDFATLVQTLQDVSRGEGELLALQQSLSENLRVLKETQQLDEAVHGLNAAIHLLTARRSNRAA